MIFPALHRFAQSRGLLDDLDFTEQTIHAVIHLDASGAFTGLFPVGDKKAPVKKSVSRIAARNSAAIACLGADTANRVLPGLEPDAKPITVATQSLFLEQLRALHAATHPFPTPRTADLATAGASAGLSRRADARDASRGA